MRLLLRFILAASILFIGFSIIAYLLLLNISNQNLDRYFNQLYAHNSRLINRIVDENLGTLRALAELEEYQDKLARELQEYRNTTGLFKPAPLWPASPLDEGVPDEMPLRSKFISMEGIIINSDEPQSRYSRFNFFKRITEQVEAGRTSGSIIIAAGEIIRDRRIMAGSYIFINWFCIMR